ncbi:tyrosine--tRNA ligase, mitochondrial [Brevipalpus obovatus]|uniref:tyrosine--tRNA ligase, mitochondrial n=1 Tax=Brevipalpus obovatus TaxID=246614 RepID=UPI003D9ECD22
MNYSLRRAKLLLDGTGTLHRLLHVRELSRLWPTLKSRGLIKEWLPQNKETEIRECLVKEQVFYAGFDPTGPSLHVGNLLIIMNLLHSLRCGHKVICVIGDATASIGDPSGKDREREPIDDKVLNTNSSRISSQLSAIFANHYKYFWKSNQTTKLPDPIILYNSSWYNDMKLFQFFKEVGYHLGMRNLTRKSFVENRSRNLTYAEFSYQVIQAYDWYRLFNTYGCRFQFGGSDQIQNIEAGSSLVRGARDVDVFGIFTPLLLDKDGKKRGKTEGNALFLDKLHTTPFDFYQAIIRLPHSAMETYLKYFSFYSETEIESILQKGLKKHSFYAQERLAESLTLLVHGESGLNQAINATEGLLNNKIEALSNLTEDDIYYIFGRNIIKLAEFDPDGTTVLDLVNRTKCFTDSTLAVTMIEKGAVYINGRKFTNPQQLVGPESVLQNNLTIVKIGNKRAFIIRWL